MNKQPEKPHKPKVAKDAILEMINHEERFSNPRIIQSFLILKSELDYLNEGLKRKDMDQRLLAYLKEAREKILSNKKNLENSFQSGKLNGKNYLTMLDQCLMEHQTLFKEAKSLNDKGVLARLAKRLDLLTKEKNKIKQDPINEFNNFMKLLNPNLQVDPNKKFSSDMPKNQVNTAIKVPKLPSDYKGRMNDELEEEQVDSLPLMKRILLFKKRHKQYHNFATYLSKHVKFKKLCFFIIYGKSATNPLSKMKFLNNKK